MQDVVDKMNMKEITIVFGQTEFAAVPRAVNEIRWSSGQHRTCFRGVECKIGSRDNEELPQHRRRICPVANIMKGYYKMPTQLQL